MSLLTKSFDKYGNELGTDVLERPTNHPQNDELVICTESVVKHTSPMSEKLKELKRKEVGSLEELFYQMVEEKGEHDSLEVFKNADGELEVEGVSSLALHSFILKAEGIGKGVTYTRALKIKISD